MAISQSPESLSSGVTPDEKRGAQGLRAGAMGLGGVLFLSFAAMSPLTGALGNVPYAVGFGNGNGAPGGFVIGIAVFVIFSIGYVAMTRKLSTSGGLYSFASHGLGRPAGMASGWAAIASYTLIEAAVIGGFSYFANTAIKDAFGVSISWVLLAALCLVLIAACSHFDVSVSTKILGVALIGEVLVLAILVIAIMVQGGAQGIDTGPLNPVGAFQGTAPAVGIFFAIYCWTGFEIIPNFAEESKDPKRTGSLALYITVVVAGLFLLVVSWAAVIGWGVDNAVDSASSDPGNFFFALASNYVGSPLKDVMQWLIVTSTFACALAFHNTAARYLFAMGREGVFSRRLGRAHPKHKSPHVASATATAITATLIGAIIVLWAVSPSAHEFSDFASLSYIELYGWYGIMATFLILTNLMLCSFSCLFFFRKPENVADWHWWKTCVAPLTSIGLFAVLFYLLWTNVSTFGGDVIFVHVIPFICVGWFLSGLLVAVYLKRRRPEAYEVLGRVLTES